jgi:hypothetical protein
LRGPLANTRLRSRTTWKEALPCQINIPVQCSGFWSYPLNLKSGACCFFHWFPCLQFVSEACTEL